MGLFDRSAETILALKVGELSASVARLTERLAALEARPATVEATPPVPTAMSPKMLLALGALAQGNNLLYRHLRNEAQGMLALGMADEDEVIGVLARGSSRPTA